MNKGWKFGIAAALVGITSSCQSAVRLTMYDDGLACPSGCDAHVVFHPSMNGTEFAHDPSSAGGPFKPCSLGATCRLCIDPGGRQCFVATYRGGGPAPNTFDLTPAFFEEKCKSSRDVPALAAKCRELALAAAKLNDKINCIRDSPNTACAAVMEAATSSKEEDRSAFEECNRVGQATFNSARPEAERRSLGCAYEAVGTGGPNSKGVRWRKLLPGACRTGTFVGRDGLDCCSGNVFADGHLGVECSTFYLSPAR
jgi:hypothetical protein